MKLLACLAAFGLASASHPGTVSFPFSKGYGPSLSKRAGTLNSVITDYQQSLYYINFTLGTPPQPLAVQLDTGSSDFIVVGTGSPLCNDGVSCVTGTYDRNKSSTVQNSPLMLNNSYGDGTIVIGNFVTDTLGLDGDSIPDVDVAVAMTGNTQNISFIGLMGVGYDALEGSAQMGSSYPNILDSLNNSGQVSSDTFSLWLDDLESSTGTILFGGVDISKFVGNLNILNVQKIQGQYLYYNVPLAAMSLSGSSSSVNLGGAQSVLLDSGSSVMTLPQSVIDSLTSPLSLSTDSSGNVLIPCSMSSSSMSIGFQFGSTSAPSISVAMSELTTSYPGSTKTCLFGIQPGSPGNYILGDTFLRSAYVLFNLEDNVIGIAQTNTNPGTSNIIALNSTTSGTITIPSGTAVASQVSVSAPSGSGNAGVGPNPSATASKSSEGAMLGVGKSVYLGAWAGTAVLVLAGVCGGGMLAL